MYTYHYRERRPLRAGSPIGGVVGRLIIANIVVFILEHLFAPNFALLFSLTPRDVVERFFIWQVITYMFLHAGFIHLLFNMIMLWLFGSLLETVWGSRRFLNYYFTCGIGGAVFSFIFNYNHHIMGASAAIFGLYLAYAMLFPNSYVYLYFLFPVKAKHLLIFLAALQLALGLSGPSGIAYFAHLGGMAAGLLLFRREIAKMKWIKELQYRWRQSSSQRAKAREEQNNAKIDSILDKISAKGYEHLSPTEKRILENYSRKRKEESE